MKVKILKLNKMDINCPYCDEPLDICHDESIKHEIECDHCLKSFVFQTSIIYSYEAEKADCLNDGNHDYKLTHTHPKEWSKMKCTMCGKERELTENEKINFYIS